MLKNEAIKIYNIRKKINSVIYDSNQIEIYFNSENLKCKEVSNLIFYDLISKLSERQKRIIDMKYRLNLTDVEISTILNISRQAVNKNKRVALKVLYKEL